MDDPTDALHRFYALEGERDRLTATARGVLEFERTKEILLRRLPRRPRWWPTSAAAPAATPCGWPGAATGSSTATSSRCTSTSSGPTPTASA